MKEQINQIVTNYNMGFISEREMWTEIAGVCVMSGDTSCIGAEMNSQIGIYETASAGIVDAFIEAEDVNDDDLQNARRAKSILTSFVKALTL